jgi:hypothetical protein
MVLCINIGSDEASTQDEVRRRDELMTVARYTWPFAGGMPESDELPGFHSTGSQQRRRLATSTAVSTFTASST